MFKKKEGNGDKIINNSYNRGDIEFDPLKPIKIDSDYLESSSGYFEPEDAFRINKLEENLYNSLNNSIYKEFLTIKPNKSNLGEIYSHLKNDLIKISSEYTKCEFFICVISILDVSYESLYSSLYLVHKSELIEELDKERNIFKRKNFSPLF